MHLKRIFLLGMVGSLAAAALAGIYAFLFGRFSELEVRILLTTLTIGLFSLTALGAAIVSERGVWRPAMYVAFGVSGFGVIYYLYLIWLHELMFPQGPYWDGHWRLTALTAVWAVALPHMGLLALAPQRDMLHWARLLAITFVALLGLTISGAVLSELDAVDGMVIARAIGVCAILAALGTITVPILARVQRIDKTLQTESTSMSLQLTCPRCLHAQTVQSGHARCEKCRLKFHIEIEEPRCPDCNYLLHMLTEPVCPECGRALDHDSVPAPAPPPRRRLATVHERRAL